MIRILLAEDDDVMREYLARALTGAGYHVTAVDRGTEAVPYIDSGTFDLLLSDIVMPEMAGIELAQHTAKVHHRFRGCIAARRRECPAGQAAVQALSPQGSGARGRYAFRPRRSQQPTIISTLRAKGLPACAEAFKGRVTPKRVGV